MIQNRGLDESGHFPGEVLKGSGRFLGGSWLQEGLLGDREASWASLGGVLGVSWAVLEASRGRLGGVLESSWGRFGPSWGVMWASWGRFGGILCLKFSLKGVRFRHAILDAIFQLIFDGFCLRKSIPGFGKFIKFYRKNVHFCCFQAICFWI